MKKISIVFGMIAVITGASVVAYFVYRNRKLRDCKEPTIQETHQDETKVASMSDLYEEKELFSESITQRHNIAAQLIRDTLEEEMGTYHSDNEHTLDLVEIDSKLDALLDEEI